MSQSKVTKRAVLVGCNYPFSKFRLTGCVNDVKTIKDVIIKKFGFHEDNIQVLTDDNTSPVPSQLLPTGANIKAALNEMLRKAAPRDVLFFYFSGHGTAVPVLVPGRHFRQDEAIVPCDFNLITDLDFRRLVNRVPEGASFTVLSDSCHSGGLIEKEKKQNIFAPVARDPTKRNLKVKPKFLVFDFINTAIDAAAGFAGNAIDAAAGFAHDGLHKIAEGAHKIFGKDVSLTFHPVQRAGGLSLDPLHEDEGILLSGCDSDETSYDIMSGDQAYGVFTHEVVDILKNVTDSITNRELMETAAKAVYDQGYEQHQNPCLYCSDKNSEKPFLGGLV